MDSAAWACVPLEAAMPPMWGWLLRGPALLQQASDRSCAVLPTAAQACGLQRAAMPPGWRRLRRGPALRQRASDRTAFLIQLLAARRTAAAGGWMARLTTAARTCVPHWAAMPHEVGRPWRDPVPGKQASDRMEEVQVRWATAARTSVPHRAATPHIVGRPWRDPAPRRQASDRMAVAQMACLWRAACSMLLALVEPQAQPLR